MNTRRLSLIALLASGMLMLSLTGGNAAAQQVEPQEAVAPQAAIGTAFSYQGKLDDAGIPADGLYDFEFKLYDSSGGNGQVGSTVQADDVEVVDGFFTVELDFGSVFSGAARWLEVAVRPGASAGAYTVLSPRELLRPAPYALGLPNVYAQESPFPLVLIGREYRIGSEYFGVQAPVNAGYGGMYMETLGENGLPFYGYATDGSARAWHYYSGASSQWRLYNNGNHLVVGADGDVGVGTTSPDATLDVDGTIRSSADTMIEVSPFDMIESDGLSRLSFAAKFNGRMQVTNNGTAGERYVYVPVSIPSTLHGTPQKLKSLYFCYSLPVAGDVLLGQIEQASVRQIDESFNDSNLLFSNSVPVVAPERCWTVNASSPTEVGGSIWIRFQLQMNGNATIEFGRIALTLTSQ